MPADAPDGRAAGKGRFWGQALVKPDGEKLWIAPSEKRKTRELARGSGAGIKEHWNRLDQPDEYIGSSSKQIPGHTVTDLSQRRGRFPVCVEGWPCLALDHTP